jgi:hypothetical protein
MTWLLYIYHSLNGWLEGLPDTVLSVILVGFAGFAVCVALFGNPLFKAAVIAWFLFP